MPLNKAGNDGYATLGSINLQNVGKPAKIVKTDKQA